MPYFLPPYFGLSVVIVVALIIWNSSLGMKADGHRELIGHYIFVALWWPFYLAIAVMAFVLSRFTKDPK